MPGTDDHEIIARLEALPHHIDTGSEDWPHSARRAWQLGRRRQRTKLTAAAAIVLAGGIGIGATATSLLGADEGAQPTPAVTDADGAASTHPTCEDGTLSQLSMLVVGPGSAATPAEAVRDRLHDLREARHVGLTVTYAAAEGVPATATVTATTTQGDFVGQYEVSRRAKGWVVDGVMTCRK